MKRILLLNDSEFPNRFNSVIVIPPSGITKIQYTENKIIDALNAYNPKLNVDKIEYLTIETQFPKFKNGKPNGVLIEEFEINSSLTKQYQSNGCYVYTNGGKNMCRRIMMYVFVSGADENTRTAFISQTVFPTLLDYADDYLSSPSYTIANHKFCFINILNKTITANMILRHLASLYAAGMDYVEVFNNGSIEPKKIPKNLKNFLKQYATDFDSKYNSITDIFEDDNYRIEFKNKLFVWKASHMAATKIVKKGAKVDFQGSNEKFYWIETLPMAIFAYDLGFKIDYTDYRDFITAYKHKFSAKSEKFARCEVLLKYISKYFI